MAAYTSCYFDKTEGRWMRKLEVTRRPARSVPDKAGIWVDSSPDIDNDLFENIIAAIIYDDLTRVNSKPVLTSLSEFLREHVSHPITNFIMSCGYAGADKDLEAVLKVLHDQSSHTLCRLALVNTGDILLPGCLKTCIIKSWGLSKFCNLKYLDLRHGNLERLDGLDSLVNLEQLSLRDNALPCIPNYYLLPLRNLTHLTLSDNLIEYVPSKLYHMTSLVVLKMWGNPIRFMTPKCNSERQTLSSMKNLGVLNFAKTRIMFLPKELFMLTQLKELYFNDCFKLKPLPENLKVLTNLTRLDLNRCNLSSIPDIFGGMKQLSKLVLRGNRLSHLPASLGNLNLLEYLHLGQNQFAELPDFLSEPHGLSSLAHLNLSGNSLMTGVPEGLITHIPLEVLTLTKCFSLRKPPYNVCLQGLQFMRDYYSDLSGFGVAGAPTLVAVVGASMAGKTSIVKSLQRGHRYLTERTGSAEDPDATRVFSLENVPLADFDLRFIDFAGHELYHHTYHMNIRDHCIPLFVVDLSMFLEKRKQVGQEAACKECLFYWISYLYVASPLLGLPLLVLTHTDKIKPLNGPTDQRRKAIDSEKHILIHTVNQMRADANSKQEEYLQICDLELSDEEGQELSGFQRIPMLSHNWFSDDKVFEVDNSTFTGLADLADVLQNRVMQEYRPIPLSWRQSVDRILSNEASCMPFTEFKAICGDESMESPEEFAKYMHSSGMILMICEPDSSPLLLFTDLHEVALFLQSLFRPDLFKEAVTGFKRNTCNFKRKDELELHINRATAKGIVTKKLMQHLTSLVHNSINTIEGFALLQYFHLLFGPVDFESGLGNEYIVPLLSEGSVHYHKKGDLVMQIEFLFTNLPLPREAYHQVTVDLCKYFHESTCGLTCFKDGLIIELDKCNLHVMHIAEKWTIKIWATIGKDISDIVHGWKAVQNATALIHQHVQRGWPGLLFKLWVICSHCLRLGLSDPRREELDVITNQEDTAIEASSVQFKNQNSISGECGGERLPVLLTDCYNSEYPVTSEQAAACISYLERYEVSQDEDDDDNETPQVVHSCARLHIYREGQTPDYGSGDAELIMVRATKPENIICGKDIYDYNTENGGKAIIINNSKFACSSDKRNLEERKGSERDVEHMKALLEALSFDVTEYLDCPDMLKVIARETRNVYCNAFMLVIMTHGSKEEEKEPILYNAMKPGDHNGPCNEHIMESIVLNMLNSRAAPRLAGKPKLVIIQACAGSSPNVVNAVPSPETLVKSEAAKPTPDDQSKSSDPFSLSEHRLSSIGKPQSMHQDLIVFRSSYSGTLSYRSEEQGSIFIRCIVKTFARFAYKDDLQELYRKIRKNVTAATQSYENEGEIIQAVQTPNVTTNTLLKKFHFFPGYPQWK